MKKVKITVLKTTLDKELAKEYGADGLTACPMLKEGEVFYADYAKPVSYTHLIGVIDKFTFSIFGCLILQIILSIAIFIYI